MDYRGALAEVSVATDDNDNDILLRLVDGKFAFIKTVGWKPG